MKTTIERAMDAIGLRSECWSAPALAHLADVWRLFTTTFDRRVYALMILDRDPWAPVHRVAYHAAIVADINAAMRDEVAALAERSRDPWPVDTVAGAQYEVRRRMFALEIAADEWAETEKRNQRAANDAAEGE